MQALLQFVRFGLPWDFGTSITIARGGVRPVVTICGKRSAGQGRMVGSRGPRRVHPDEKDGLKVVPLSSGHVASAGTSIGAGNDNTAALTRPQGKRKAARPRHGQIGNVGKGMPAIPRPQGTRASANTSGPDSTLARRPLVKLRSPYEGDPHRTKKTCFFYRTGLWRANPRKRTIRPLT